MVCESCSKLIDQVIELRKSKGWTQHDLAMASHLTQSVIARIETKKSTPTLATFQKLVSSMGATLILSMGAGDGCLKRLDCQAKCNR